MSNVCEPLHHRNKEVAYGYLQTIAKRLAVKMGKRSLLSLVLYTKYLTFAYETKN